MIKDPHRNPPEPPPKKPLDVPEKNPFTGRETLQDPLNAETRRKLKIINESSTFPK